MQDVLITGIGIVSPIGIGVDEVAASLHGRRTGIHAVEELERIGWIAPFGGQVADFDPKQYVTPRKSLKVMAREIQLGFAAAELAWSEARLDDFEVEPSRLGVVGAAAMQYCPLDELAPPFAACGAGQASERAWAERGMSELFPLWMLKYLPNMGSCHVGIRRDAHGPTNTISLGDVSGLIALGEAASIIRRGAADIMLCGGASSKIDLTDLLWHAGAGLSRRAADPERACRPFDADRDGAVMSEAATYLVIESRDHAERRGFFRRGGTAWGTVEAVVCRSEPAIGPLLATGRAIGQAAQTALKQAGLKASDLALVKPHGESRKDLDAIEAQALQAVVGDVPATAPTSYLGSSGAARGLVELAATLIGWRNGVVNATLNYDTPDPACPLNLSAVERPAKGSSLLALNHSPSGQAVAAILNAPD
ncbi:beta-ketoacyl-[acyl-carrier-protein] synthase family protein [Botrimarina hoheduenensis]|uniref:3-oxoacyl-[acyl-carrier-protein] synthase 2 n=1 Tax=Botrimarina hoheduenensis TaxID=2528000 RepID=A0A5C5WBH9_9BACT|nr:beta-ketoacyl synthase N-terminal-like domain-containing protein [Botrimarina hoheduenensis]TWT48248.1 3-oxoacyl-[acyl-carrier-protein] synthase 2 [Botrimarina hoheduenensis]